MEEPPETPAPLFAVRAFKTAIFGTPHPDQSDVKPHTQPAEQKKDIARTQPTEESEGINAHDAVKVQLDTPVPVPKVDSLASPTKGILLTPGTGATRRKTVSFGSLIADAQKKEQQLPATEAKCELAPECKNDSKVRKPSPRIQPRQSSLTKTLIQMSRQKIEDQAISIPSREESLTREPASSNGAQMENTAQSPDNTVDLSQPRSRSGQHWKTEYEQYHKRSNIEMKKMIMYGQNVKSYAVKKDSEATSLGEKLKNELAKVSAMEKKVSKLAAQLNNAYAHGPEGESEQTRLVSELAQQTALAIRYKQKADRYRRAMQKENRADGSDRDGDTVQVSEKAFQETRREADLPEVAAQSAENGTLHAQLESLRVSAKKAEDQAAKLEAENSALKQSLARVKGEMMSYEARRQAREERYKRREANTKVDQKACEAQLAKLTVEHQNLLLATRQSTNAEGTLAHPQPTACSDGHRNNVEDAKPPHKEGSKTNTEPLGQNRVSKPYVSPRKSRLQRSTVDIWTLSSPRDAADNVSPSKEPTDLPPSSVRHDIQRTLKEIDRNLIPEQHAGTKSKSETQLSPVRNEAHKLPTDAMPHPQPQSQVPSPVHQGPTTSSPNPSAEFDNQLPSNPAERDPSDMMVKATVRNSRATVGRSASLLSRAGSRTSTMASVRGSALSAERAAAAKARLAARSAEKRRGGDGRGG